MSLVDLNLKITGHSSQGGRKYMEDAFVVAYQHTPDGKDLEYAFFGIFDGHGGKEAAQYAKRHLLNNITSFKNFWLEDDDQVLKAIRDGFLCTHLAMGTVIDNWPKTVTGLQSTAGTTASIVFLRKGKLYSGHVGDSRIVLGLKDKDSDMWTAKCLTQDHKPESPVERKRIYACGGQVMNKSGVERVVWKRPRTSESVRHLDDFDKIPFLAVARSLGDLWSYDYIHKAFVVSPVPDVDVMTLDVKKHHCLLLASDGLWNMMSPKGAVSLVQDVIKENKKHILRFGLSENTHLTLCNPSKVLVDCALERWNQMQMRADNTSVVTVILEPANAEIAKIQILKEQLSLKMSCPKDFPKTPKDEDNNNDVHLSVFSEIEKIHDSLNKKSEPRENMESRLGYLNLATKLYDGEKDSSYKNSFETERHTNSPLQSCSNFLPRSPTPKLTARKMSSDGIENSPCPFPRWSKNASGRTSLSKLATWSEVVSHRRMSDPFPYKYSDKLYFNDCFKALCSKELCSLNSSSDCNGSSKDPEKKKRELRNLLFGDKIFRATFKTDDDVKVAVKRKCSDEEFLQSLFDDYRTSETENHRYKKLNLLDSSA